MRMCSDAKSDNLNLQSKLSSVFAVTTDSSKAVVDRPRILATVNGSVGLHCKAPAGETVLSLCLWKTNSQEKGGGHRYLQRCCR